MWTISPPKARSAPALEPCCKPVLSLNNFSVPPTVEFGSVALGECSVKVLTVHNPNKSNTKVWTHQYKDKKGFRFQQEEFVVPAQSEVQIQIEWCPREEGGCRQVVQLRSNSNLRLQLVLLGQCTKQADKKKSAVKKAGTSQQKGQNFTSSSSQRVTQSSDKENIQPVKPSRQKKTLKKKTTPTHEVKSSQVFQIQD